jgi:putative flippase GtrA
MAGLSLGAGAAGRADLSALEFVQMQSKPATSVSLGRWPVKVGRTSMGQMAGTKREARLAIKFIGVSMVGFVTDAVLLQLGIASGMEAAWARLISLGIAMQVTFVINALIVFRAHDRSRWPTQWLHYMLTNGFGNFCNYLIFVTLVSTHWPIISNHFVALCVGAFCAWMMNFASARFVVFGKRRWGRAATPPDALPEAAKRAPTQS